MNSSAPALPLPSRPRILLVEDDSTLRRSLQLSLQARGFEVRAHASGVTMLQDAAWADAACMLADCHLEKPDGFEILSSLRARGWEGPALLICDELSDDLCDRAIAGGFAQIIEPPFRDSVVADTVARLTGVH